MPVIPAGDLTKLRAQGHKTKLYMVIQTPLKYNATTGVYDYANDAVWYGTVRAAPVGDPITSVLVSGAGGAGNATILDGMTVLFSRVAYGKWEQGTVRAHGDQTIAKAGNGTLYIAVSSDLSGLQIGDFVVVLDEFRFWTRYPKITEAGGTLTWYKDYGTFLDNIGAAATELLWTALGANDTDRRQASMPAVPIMSSHIVRFLDAGETAALYFDWQDSYTPAPSLAVNNWTGSGEIDHAGSSWVSALETPGDQNYSAISGLRGFRVKLEVAHSGADPINEFRRGIRYVFTLRRPGNKQAGDPDDCYPITEFAADSIAGSYDQGGWRTRITLFDSQADEFRVRPGSLVILFADDWYGDTQESIGPNETALDDRENIVMTGYVLDGSIVHDSETGNVQFDIGSVTELMKSRENYPVPIEWDAGADEWYKTPNLTVDRACHHYITWHTNLKLISDVYQTGDTNSLRAQDFLSGNAYSTIDQFLWDRIFARLLCDRFGRCRMEIDREMQAVGSGATTFALENGDWIDQIQADEINESPTSVVDLGGLYMNAGLITPFLSHAPGDVSRYTGTPESMMSLCISGQAGLNTLSGRRLAYLNCRFPRLTLQHAGNWRVFDITPQDYIDVNYLVTKRHTFSNDLFIVREVEFAYSPQAGTMFTSTTSGMETLGIDGATIPVPEDPPDPPAPPIPDPPPDPGLPTDTGRRIISTNVGVFATDDIGSSYPYWYGVNSGIPTDYIRCYKIIRDPWHWWTSEGAERTLWGLFDADPGGYTYPRFVYKMENFPHGTWVESLDITTLAMSGINPTWEKACYDIVGSIEVQDLLYIAAFHHTGGIGSGPGYLVRTVNGGTTWTVVSSSIANMLVDFTPGWPYRFALVDTGKHSAAQRVAFLGNLDSLTPLLSYSINGGTTWAVRNPNAIVAGLGNLYAGGILVPYDNPIWSDATLVMAHQHYDSPTIVTVMQRSDDYGVTWTNQGSFVPANCFITAVSEYTNDRLKVAALISSTAAGGDGYIYTTNNGGTDWTLWATISGKAVLSAACQFGWSADGTLINALVWSQQDSQMLLVMPAGIVDKTGNLLAAASGIDVVTSVERDTMGSA